MNQIFETNETLQKEFSYKDYFISFHDLGGRPYAKFYKVLKSGKNKGRPKLIEHFAFRSPERRIEWAEQTLKIVKERYLRKQEKIDQQKICNENFLNPYKVGEIFYDSWGWEQTNIDFYMITSILPKSVVVRKIGQIVVNGSEGFMCENVKPNPNEIIGEEKIKKVKTSFYNNEISYSIGLLKYTHGEKGVYQSHYA